MDLIGFIDGVVIKVGVLIVDEVVGFYLVQGVLVVFLKCQCIGCGVHVEIVLIDVLIFIFIYQVQQYLIVGI